MGIRENIIKLRDEKGITQEQLAKIAGVSRAAVSQWEGGFSEPRMGAIQKIADHFKLSKSNLIEEDGMDYAKPYPIPDNAIFPVKSEYAVLPLLGKVHAGDAVEPDILDETVELPKSVADRHPDAYFLKVEGNCMSKVYPEGCFILIDPTVKPQNGSIAVVSINEADYVMRRLYRGANTLILSPDSYDETYEDIVISSTDDYEVKFVGTVIWYQPEKEMA